MRLTTKEMTLKDGPQGRLGQSACGRRHKVMNSSIGSLKEREEVNVKLPISRYRYYTGNK